MSPRKALIAVDIQNDFCEGGSLAVPGGAAVAASVTAWIESHRGDYAAVAATRDWHRDPGGHFSAQPDYHESWPVHCEAETSGAGFHPLLTATFDEIFSKGETAAAYSGFEARDASGTLLGDWLRARAIDAVDVVGIATDYCVRATALDAAAAGFATSVLVDLTAAVAPESARTALDELKAAGIAVVKAEEQTFLDSYDAASYPPVAVTVDVVLLTIRHGQLSVLLVRRAGFPYRSAWALPGGFVSPHESLDEAARRELAEEAGVHSPAFHLEQLRTYGDPGRDPRMRVVSVAYLGLGPDLPSPTSGSDASAARWWPVADIGTADGPDLAFDHERILADGTERARAKLEYTPLATAFVEEPFTLAELRRIYEAVWGHPVHPANFRRKVLSTAGFVIPEGRTAPAGPEGGRPADLYRRGPATLLHPAMLRPSTTDDAEALAAAQEEGAL